MTEKWNCRGETEFPVEGRRETESRQYGEPSGDPTAQVIKLARKAASVKTRSARTVNRHRWVGRVS